MVNHKGEIIDSTDNSDALSFIQGYGSVIPAIEKQIEGHHTGDRLTFALKPTDSYGERDESKVKVIPKSQFNMDGDLHVGMQFYTHKNGHDIPVTITTINDQQITIDGNHPLAGADINVDLVIVDVREAIDVELESGEVQTDEDIFNN